MKDNFHEYNRVMSKAMGIGISMWVDPNRTKSKSSHPYSYDAFYIWRDKNLKDSGTVYHDRMQQWDYSKFEEACKLTEGKRFSQYNRAEVSKFLSAYFNKKIKATALVEGCNASNGYPYWIFYFKGI